MVLQEERVWRTLTSVCLLPQGKSAFVYYRSQWPKEGKTVNVRNFINLQGSKTESPRPNCKSWCKVEVNNKVVEKEKRGNGTDGSHCSLLRLLQVSPETPRNTALVLGEWEHSGASFSRPPSVQMCWHCHSHRLQEESCTRKKTLLLRRETAA